MTEEAKHTPGPRMAVKIECGHQACVMNNKKYGPHKPGATHGFVLANDGEMVVGRFNRYEDAVIDAAAPDLLEALEIVQAIAVSDRAFIERAGFDFSDRTKQCSEWAQEKINAAIAKARGQS